MLHHGTWGSVFNDDFDDRDAIVACKTLGYSEGNYLIPGTKGSGMIAMNDLNCISSDTNLDMCDIAILDRKWG